MYESLVNYNDCNNALLCNYKLQQEISKVIEEEEADICNMTLDAHKVTVDTFYQKPVTQNTQGENENMICISERQNNFVVLAETLKASEINNVGYYEYIRE